MRNFVRHLPVHCCGEPATRIGWVPAPRVTAPGPIRFAIGHMRTDLLTGEVTLAGRLDTEVAWIVDGDDRQLVVMSAGRPIETWRKVPGFIAERQR